MSADASSPAEVTLALKIAYLRGSWEAVSEVIHALEYTFGEVRLSDLVLQEGRELLERMEAPHEEEEEQPTIYVIDWHEPAEA